MSPMNEKYAGYVVSSWFTAPSKEPEHKLKSNLLGKNNAFGYNSRDLSNGPVTVESQY